jgi:two-component system chemotaxis response regulator CheB
MINDSESDATFLSLEAGALTVMPKPVDIQSPAFERVRRNIVDTVKSMSEIKVITKRRIAPRSSVETQLEVVPHDYKIVVIGSSVGGPQALKEILSRLPSNFPLPIVAAQHMTRGFIDGFTKWMDGHVGLKVKTAEEGEMLSPGVVYFAPDGSHFQVSKMNDAFRASLVAGPPVSGFCPSITVLMKSVAKHAGNRSVGILLTGMGSDGADGLLTMKHGGAHTLIQDPDSCVVFGMAGVAQSLGAVDKVVNLDKIAEYLIRITNKKRQDPK